MQTYMATYQMYVYVNIQYTYLLLSIYLYIYIYGNEKTMPCLLWHQNMYVFFEAAMQAAAMLGAVWRPKKLHNFPSKARDIHTKKY